MDKNETAEKPRYIPVLFTPSLLERIDEYRWTNRISSRAEAMRILIESGLEATAKKPPASAKPVPSRRRKSGD